MTAIKTCDTAEVRSVPSAFPPACDACRIRTCARNAIMLGFGLRRTLRRRRLFHVPSRSQHDHLVAMARANCISRHDERGLAGIGEFQHHVVTSAHHFRIVTAVTSSNSSTPMQDQHGRWPRAGVVFRQPMARHPYGRRVRTRSKQSDGFFPRPPPPSRFCTSVGASDVAEHGFVGEQVALGTPCRHVAQLAVALAAAGRSGARLAGFDTRRSARWCRPEWAQDPRWCAATSTCPIRTADDDEYPAMGHVEERCRPAPACRHWRTA